MPYTFTRQEMVILNPEPFRPLEPLLYHAHHLLRADDLSFWQTLADECGDPILELGCGTGRILLPLAESGKSLTGLDSDPEMLSYLRANMSDENIPSIRLHKADMRTFHLPERFQLAMLPCNTYSNFPSEERMQISTSVADHLSPGGIFAVSIPNPELLASLEPFGDYDLEETFPHPETGHPVEVYSQWKKTTETITFIWRYDHRFPTGNTVSQLATTQHYLDAPEMILDELQQSGLIPFQLYGSYDRDPFDAEESVYLIILAKKQAD